MKGFYLILFLIVTKIVSAQPGPDDAGLLINRVIYGSTGKELMKDTNFTYKQYLLNRNGEKILQEITGFNFKKYSIHPRVSSFIYLPPFYSNDESDSKKKDYPNQRLDLIYRSDTMRIDFMDLKTISNNIYTPEIDSIVFCPGYFKLYMNPEKKKPELFKGELLEVQKLKREFYQAYSRGINFLRDGLLVQHEMLEAERDNNRLQEMYKRDLRESCSEINVQGNYFQLCADNILVKEQSADILTNQRPQMVDGKTVYYFSYYSSSVHPSYDHIIRAPITISSYKTKVKEKRKYYGYFAKPEDQIALEKYESLQKNKVSINGKVFSGQLKFLMRYSPWFDVGIYTGTGWHVRILTYKNGVLITDETKKEIQPTDK